MSTTRIYLIRGNEAHEGKKVALVRASSAAQASRHFFMRNFDVSVPSQDDLIDARDAGLVVENAEPTPTTD